MDHIFYICQDHLALAISILVIMGLAGFGLGLGIKYLLPAVKAFRGGTEVNILSKETPAPGPVCKFPCDLHPDMKAFVDSIKHQQSKNMEILTGIRVQQENNTAVIALVSEQQTRMWEIIRQNETFFGAIKGELGEIKGMIKILHKEAKG